MFEKKQSEWKNRLRRGRERERERERENTVKQSDTKRKEIEGVRDIWYIICFLYFFSKCDMVQ